MKDLIPTKQTSQATQTTQTTRTVPMAQMTDMPPIHPRNWQLCVAPMIDVTDRHCRFFHRLLAPKARLYSEMTTTGALIFGDQPRHLDFNEAEHPVALQLGGCDPAELATCARIGERWGYDEINLNCGCPSDRVQKGAFGACLMRDPKLVADGIKAMQDAVSVPVTVKHRLGLDGTTDYGFVRDFVGQLFDVGCRVFIVHARHAILGGLSPKENREIPPLQFDQAAKLRRDFSQAVFVVNGGLTTVDGCRQALPEFDGVMLGRAAWHDPAMLNTLSVALGHREEPARQEDVVAAMVQYAHEQVARGVPLRVIARTMLGFAQGQRGARRWRQMLSDQSLLAANDPELIWRAWAAVHRPESPELSANIAS